MYVNGHLKKWFEEQSPRSMHAAVEVGLQRAWTQACRQIEDGNGAVIRLGAPAPMVKRLLTRIPYASPLGGIR
jgi:hypothetical protein